MGQILSNGCLFHLYFVRYYSREDTEDAVKYISGTILDDRPIRVDFDWGFQDGRQWGRGRSGGQVLFLIYVTFLTWSLPSLPVYFLLLCCSQVRDEYRMDYDPDILFSFHTFTHYIDYGNPQSDALKIKFLLHFFGYHQPILVSLFIHTYLNICVCVG